MDLEKSKQSGTKNPQLKQAFGKAKLFEVRRLVRGIKRLSAKKGTTQQLEKNKRKISRIEKQLEVLKDLHLDTFVKAASAKTHGNELNSSDFMSGDEEDVATKMVVLEKIINAVGLDNIKDLCTKKTKDTAVKSSKKKRSKYSGTVSSKTCKNSLPQDDEELDTVRTQSKEDKELDDFFTDPVFNDHNSMDSSKVRTYKRRKLEAEGDSHEISSTAFDSVFVENLKGGKGKRKARSSRKNFKEKEKNRLGQRERRRQWEKLYGKKANHLKNEKRKQEQPSKSHVKKSGKIDGKKQQDKATDSAYLHPSWEASKSKRKQESIVEFKGQKIVFED